MDEGCTDFLSGVFWAELFELSTVSDVRARLLKRRGFLVSEDGTALASISGRKSLES